MKYYSRIQDLRTTNLLPTLCFFTQDIKLSDDYEIEIMNSIWMTNETDFYENVMTFLGLETSSGHGCTFIINKIDVPLN